MLGAHVDGLFPEILYFITLENDVSYNLAANQSVIMRYVKAIPTFTPISPALYSYFRTFLVITLVLELITNWFMADISMMIRSFI